MLECLKLNTVENRVVEISSLAINEQKYLFNILVPYYYLTLKSKYLGLYEEYMYFILLIYIIVSHPCAMLDEHIAVTPRL